MATDQREAPTPQRAKRADARRNEQALLDAAAEAGEIRPGTDAMELMHAVGNLCVGLQPCVARRMIGLLVAGLRQQASPEHS